ncbi:hypothetical protein AMJ44_11550, partial [candidate division WOR-1 bacterium DG_54_3]
MKGIFGFVNKKAGKVGGRGSPFRILRILLLFLLFTGVVCLLAPKSLAAFPQQINFQGKLTDDDNIPVADSSYSITFAIYNVDSGGSSLWTETQSVPTENGFFNVILGSDTSIETDVFDGSDRWLGINVAGDGEMTPRHKLVSVGHAFHAYNADMVDGLHASEIGGLSTADADARYVNVTGDSMTGTLTVTTASAYALDATSTNNSGSAVYGRATGTWGKGVYGWADNAGVGNPNYGGMFIAAGGSGRGVYGGATEITGASNYGGYFSAAGESGKAVYGEATATGNVFNHGGYFIAAGNYGRGVMGSSGGAMGYGVYGNASAIGPNVN